MVSLSKRQHDALSRCGTARGSYTAAAALHCAPMKRNREDEEVDRAIALSLASVADQRAAYRAAETQQHEEELSCAVAASLAEVDPEPVWRAPGEWDCLRCTRTNTADAGRCASCESDRMAPFASARPAAVTEVRCGLAGCSRLKAVRDYCCLEHENRALGRRMAAPTDAGVDKVIYGASGDHAYHHLTRRDPTREGVCRRFLDHWEKDAPGAAGFVATPRVERVFRIMPSPLLREAHAAYSLAVGNPRTRYHGTGARCDFGIDQNAWPCADARCALCAIAARGFRLEHSGSGPNAARVTFGTATGLRYGRGLCAHRTIEPRSASNRDAGWLGDAVCVCNPRRLLGDLGQVARLRQRLGARAQRPDGEPTLAHDVRRVGRRWQGLLRSAGRARRRKATCGLRFHRWRDEGQGRGAQLRRAGGVR